MACSLQQDTATAMVRLGIAALQLFDVKSSTWSRYLLLRFLSHHGHEPVCALNAVRVFGTTEAEDLEAQLSALEDELMIDGNDAGVAKVQPRQEDIIDRVEPPAVEATRAVPEDSTTSTNDLAPPSHPGSPQGDGPPQRKEAQLPPSERAGDASSTGASEEVTAQLVVVRHDPAAVGMLSSSGTGNDAGRASHSKAGQETGDVATHASMPTPEGTPVAGCKPGVGLYAAGEGLSGFQTDDLTDSGRRGGTQHKLAGPRPRHPDVPLSATQHDAAPRHQGNNETPSSDALHRQEAKSAGRQPQQDQHSDNVSATADFEGSSRGGEAIRSQGASASGSAPEPSTQEEGGAGRLPLSDAAPEMHAPEGSVSGQKDEDFRGQVGRLTGIDLGSANPKQGMTPLLSNDRCQLVAAMLLVLCKLLAGQVSEVLAGAA
jgi:Sad1 / UNC-like C-terminal